MGPTRVEWRPGPSDDYGSGLRPATGVPTSVSQVSIWGSADQCVEGLQRVVDSGAQMLMLNHVFDHMEQLELLAEDVVPHLRPGTG